MGNSECPERNERAYAWGNWGEMRRGCLLEEVISLAVFLLEV